MFRFFLSLPADGACINIEGLELSGENQSARDLTTVVTVDEQVEQFEAKAKLSFSRLLQYVKEPTTFESVQFLFKRLATSWSNVM